MIDLKRSSVALAVRVGAIGALVAGIAVPVQAQTPGAAPAAKSAEWLIASAVLAAPAELRADAEVRGWTPAGDDLVILRPGTNDIICLADRPDLEGFAAACYHDTLEPFMERGRELRRQGIDGGRNNETRWSEIRAGTLPMPVAAMVYNLRLPDTDFDPATTDPAIGSRLHSLYIRDATPESTGLPVQPGDAPWLMLPGTPSAHVMIVLPTKNPE